MRLTILFTLCCWIASGQTTVKDVMNTSAAAYTNSTVAVSVTATQGDGTACALHKVTNGQIFLSMSCTSADGKTTVSGAAFRSNSTAVQTFPWGLGDVLCLVAANPTATAATVGSLGAVPANAVAWSCSTNIRTGGAITGQTTPTSGSVTWP